MTNYIDADTTNWTSEVLKSDMLTLVYFWHDTCPWCIRLNPIFNEITEEYRGKLKFVKLNVLSKPENRELASNLGVMGTPTLMFFCQGRSLGQTVSYMPKEDLKKVLDDMLERYNRCIMQSSDIRNYVV
jgi:thioredoxin-like negative regulator of GroEL